MLKARNLGEGAQLQEAVASWLLPVASHFAEKWPVQEIGLVTQRRLFCLNVAEKYRLTPRVPQQYSVQTKLGCQLDACYSAPA